MTPFVILSMPRSGSNHLFTLLNQHPNIVCQGQLLDADFPNGNPDYSDTELLEAAFTGHPPDIVAAGFKLMDTELRPSLLPTLICYGCRFIVLERANQVEAARSQAQVDATGQWVWREQPPKVHVDVRECRRRIIRAQRFYQRMRRLDSAWVIYEQLRDDPDRVLDGLWQFLGVPPAQVVPVLRRQETRPLADTVINYEELRHVFGPTVDARTAAGFETYFP